MAQEPVNRVRAEQRPPQRSRMTAHTDPFYYDQSKVPVGMRYEWKAYKVGGAENEERMIQCEQTGWQPVPVHRQPETTTLAKAKEHPNAPIERRGQRLMEIPEEWYQESREADALVAHDTIESQISRLGMQARRNGAKGIGRTKEPVELSLARRRTERGGEIVE